MGCTAPAVCLSQEHKGFMLHRLSLPLFLILVLGYVFLYAPIFFVILFSFNASSVMTRFEGFSLKWYQALFSNPVLLNAAWVSLRIAFVSAFLAVLLGTLCAITLVRLRHFKRRHVLGVLSTAPLIMPEVITGFAFLIFFVGVERLFGWPHGRGVNTIIVAHTTLALAYVTVIVRARLLEIEPSLEEAAQDLGARPARAFFLVTLPLIFPSLLSGWLLSFALSMDDLVIASFTSGPGASTLPMVIFSSIRVGTDPQVNALATLIVLVVTLCVCGAALLTRQTRHRKFFKKMA